MEPHGEGSDDEFFREMMEDEEFFALDDGVLNACYIEYALEDWPLLMSLTDAEKVRIYDEFAEALRLAQSPPQVIGARGANLYLVIHQSVDLSMADIEHILDAVCSHIAERHPNQHGLQEWSAHSLGHRNIPEAVIRIGGKLYGEQASDTRK